MPQISSGQAASIVLEPGESYTISASGVATVKGIYGAPAITATLNSNFAVFGPYGVPAKLDIACVSGVCTYAYDQYEGSVARFSADGKSLVGPDGGRESAAYATLQKIGRYPLTVSGIGNSIMFSSMNWVLHACQQSKGMLIAYDRCHGVPGNTTTQMLARMTDVPAGAEIVAIQECTNDADAGVTAAKHIENMEAMIAFYLKRGQLPIICFPPARSDNATSNVNTFKLGMCDYFTAKKWGIPVVFPWRSFTNADATGGLSSAANASDGKHPGNSAHVVAGAAMLAQLLGTDHTQPLPMSSNTYGGIGLFADALHLAGNGGWSTNSGSGAVLSTVTDGAAVGKWSVATSNGGGDYQFQKSGSFAGNVGDELYVCYLLRTQGTWASGFTQVTPMQTPSFSNQFGGYAYVPTAIGAGLIYGESALPPNKSVVSGTTGLMMLGQINAPASNTIEIAQMQIWNKSAILR